MWWDRSGLHGSCFSVLLPNTDWLHDDAYRTQRLSRYVYIDNNTMWCDIGLAGFCDRTTGWTWCLRKQTQYEHDQLFQGHTYTSRKKEDKACYYYIIVWRLQNLLSLLYNKPTHGYILIHLTWLYMHGSGRQTRDIHHWREREYEVIPLCIVIQVQCSKRSITPLETVILGSNPSGRLLWLSGQR